jgi:hypothetical protein
MIKGILVSLAVLILATSAALTAQRTHNRQPMNAFASVPASPPVIGPASVSNGDRALHMRNRRDSGYDSKNDFDAAGRMVAE